MWYNKAVTHEGESGVIMTKQDYGGASLAYLGDAVIELWVRRTLLQMGIVTPSVCNSEALLFVTARSQSEALSHIEDMLTDDERDIFRRGRNAHVTTPKSASAAEYHRATGLEALMGALYIEGRGERIDELLLSAYGAVLSEMRERHGI